MHNPNFGRDIKLVGLPDLNGYLITLSMKCPCGQTLLLSGAVGTMFGCAACRKVWRINGFELNSKTDVVDIDLSIVAATPQKET